MDIQQSIFEIISRQLNVPISDLTPETHFRTLPDINSMKVLQVILETEKTFDIEVDDDVTFRVERIGQFIEIVEQQTNSEASV